jgi:hypothetical protein
MIERTGAVREPMTVAVCSRFFWFSIGFIVMVVSRFPGKGHALRTAEKIRHPQRGLLWFENDILMFSCSVKTSSRPVGIFLSELSQLQ